YNEAIRETVMYILHESMGLRLPRDMVSEEVIYLFKRSGGFNNDWDIAYSVLLYLFAKLPASTRATLGELVNSNSLETMDDPERRLEYLQCQMRRKSAPLNPGVMIKDLDVELRGFARDADISGIERLEAQLRREDNEGVCKAVKRLLRYPGPVGESLLTTVFEEVFCGQGLFRSVYRVEARFHRGPGLIEGERKILSPKTLEHLASILKGGRFGIASGRPLLSARYTLGELLSSFVSEAMVFLDAVEEAEMRMGTRLKKPHPFSLTKAAEGLRPFEAALYVGDSMGDIIMVEKANRVLTRFVSAGVYRHKDLGDRVIQDFLEAEADLVLPSVNELPLALELIKEGKICG
ncbi:MAG: HAD family hydrolase, partial [Candidatus Bathyarchaeia archaeon]